MFLSCLLAKHAFGIASVALQSVHTPAWCMEQTASGARGDTSLQLVRSFRSKAACGHGSCPHSGRQHAHILSQCRDPSATDHSEHSCGFAVRSKSAVVLPDGVLSGWLGQSANAHAFAMRHFSTSQKSQAEGGEGAANNATAGTVKHYTLFEVCSYQGCPFKGKAHSHCLACRCPDPDAKTHRHHRCGFAAGSAEAVPMPDGTLAGWSGRSRWNCEMHV